MDTMYIYETPSFLGPGDFFVAFVGDVCGFGLVCRYLLSGEELFKDDLLRAPTQHFKLFLFRTVWPQLPSILGRPFLSQDHLSLQKLKF